VHPIVRYTLLRVLLFFAVFAFLVAVGMRGLLLIVAAFAITAALSYLVLAGPRRAVVERLEARAQARAAGPDRHKRDADADLEDAALDAAQGTTAPHRTRPELERRAGNDSAKGAGS
jgi:hypothetical protein